jgi:membrane protein DedA with SNARE-associated domain
MVQSLIASSPYLGIFIALILAGLGVPIPEEIAVVTAGVLSHQGVMRWWLALPICLVGVLAGDIALYGIGRRFGERALALPLIRRILDPARRERLEAAYRARGALIVFGARHLAGVRGAAFLTAGIVRLPFWKFLLADGIAIAYGIPLNFGLAYFFSEHVGRLMAEIHRVERWIAVIAIAAVAAWVAFALRRRARHALGEGAQDQRPA